MFSACRKDLEESFTITDPYRAPTIQVDAMASLGGQVLDENNKPIGNALVTLGAMTTKTNFFGLFEFPNTLLDASGSFVKVEKEGYFNGSRRFFPLDQSRNLIKIKLLEQTTIGSFTAELGGTVKSIDGLEIEFPADGMVTEFGEAYQGAVEVNARWLDPSREDLLEIMPGNLQGIDTDNSEVALKSYGMLGVELSGGGAEKLQIAGGKKARISVPLPISMLADAPAEIPLWSFDEVLGIWKEESTAVLTDGAYVGEVGHFSFWNCDAPFPLVNIDGKVVNELGAGIAGAKVSVFRPDNSGSAIVTTDASGNFSGKVPANEALVMRINPSETGCPGIQEYPFGPITSNTSLGDIVIEDQTGNTDVLTVQGTLVDCNGTPLDQGWLAARFDSQETQYFYVEGNGGQFNFSLFRCHPSQVLEIIAFDIQSGISGFSQTFSNELNIDLGEYPVCGNSVEGYVRVKFEGEEFFAEASEFNPSFRVTMEGLFNQLDGGFSLIIPNAGLRLTMVINRLSQLSAGTYAGADEEVLVWAPFILEKSEIYGGEVERTYCDYYDCSYEAFHLTQTGGQLGDLLTGYYEASISAIVDNSIYIEGIPLRIDFSLRVNHED